MIVKQLLCGVNKESFKRSIESWSDFNRASGFIKNSKENDYLNTSQRLRRLYTIAREEFAPFLYAAGETYDHDFSVNSLIFDFPPVSQKDHESFSKEIAKHAELKLPEPYFIDLNYCKNGTTPFFGFRLFDKGDNVIWVKVINCPDFYLMDRGDLYYGVKNILDKNDMNILISRVSDYFLENKEKPSKIA